MMKAFVLTIKDIEQSQQAADRCIKSGKTHGIDVQKHYGFTPKDNPLQILEEKSLPLTRFKEKWSRLDNVVFRMGLSNTRDGARQLVSHKHILVNGSIVNIPSYTLRPGDKVSIREKSKSLKAIESSLRENISEYEWIKFNRERLEGEFISLPEREQIPENIKEQLIVELYSK